MRLRLPITYDNVYTRLTPIDTRLTRMKAFPISALISILLTLTLLLSGCEPDPETDTLQTPVDAQQSVVEPAQVVVQKQLTADQDASATDTSWQQYVAEHSTGWVAARASLYIEFQQAVSSAEDIDLERVTQALTISPAIAFTLAIDSPQRLTITPNAPLSSAQIYTVALATAAFDAIPESLGEFRFQVQTLQQDIELQVAGLMPGKEKHRMFLNGEITTNDEVDNGQIEQLLNVKQDTIALPIEWQHYADKKRHQFSVKNIVRGAKAEHLQLHWDGNPIGVDKQGRKDFEVPAIDQFSITAVHSRQTPEQYIDIAFSEPLDRNQNLSGLITLEGDNPRLRINGSHLRIYPKQKQSGELSLEINTAIRSSKRLTLSHDFATTVTFISESPGVRYTQSGSILPPNQSLSVPFEAINVNAVWVTAFKVFDHNIHNLLRDQDINSGRINTQEGRYLWKKKINLPNIARDTWQRFHVDLNEIMQQHPDGIINIGLSIDPSVSVFPCDTPLKTTSAAALENYEGPGNEQYEEHPDWYSRYYHSDNGYLSWRQRNNPCHASYYQYGDNIEAQRNFIVSNIGLIAKRGSDQELHIVATDLTEATPLSGAHISVYNFQHQEIAKGITNDQGQLQITPKNTPFYLVAQHQNDTGYLKIPANQALPTSQFDTGGSTIKHGLKGFIYGERDVWRPGDTVYLSFILEDANNRIPTDHPVSIDLFDPKGVKVSSQSNNQPAGNLYTFNLSTREDAPTGNWRAVVHVGGDYFAKTLKIETIKPNRLKVDVNAGEAPLQANHMPIRTELRAQWLNGATARGLKADTEIKLSPMHTAFEGFSQYHFDDPASDFKTLKQTVFEGRLNERGEAAFNLNVNHSRAPGKLRATFINRVFEKSGEFSKTISSVEFLPFDHWVGLHIPEGKGYRGAISRDQDHTLTLQSIDSDATPQADRKLTLNVYRLEWRWWWDQSHDNLANYVQSRHNQNVKQQTLVTDAQGRAQWTLKKGEYTWGRHLIRVCDEQSGHCSGKEVYLGWSWDNQINPDAATQLMVATDKKRYQVGETAIIKIPELVQGKLLYTLENGSRVLEQKWLELEPGARSFEVPVTAAMAPNAYVNLTLLLPHQERQSDAPIRLYGVVPLIVENPESHLKPVIVAPESVRPQTSIELSVSEDKGRSMNYTLALVDEGLLGITNYQTPNPHSAFYKKEALGVSTWDIFDAVAGAYGANLERLLRIGGGKSSADKDAAKRRRFPPVVKFLGAFQLAAGETQKHSIQLPQYMGAVRLMVVAAEDGAYGRAEHSVSVVQPLTLLTTLPRVLGPSEELALPINVFVNNDAIGEVKITAQVDDMFELTETQTSLNFTAAGDQIAFLQLKVKDKIGVGKVNISAETEFKNRDGEIVKERAEQTIYIESRAPNLPSDQQIAHLLQPGEVWTPKLHPHGISATNKASVVVSSLPPLNLDKRLDYLIRYPHGCLEQTTSAAFPQISLHQLLDLSDEQRQTIQSHVDAAIDRLKGFQRGDGSFSYWPGQSYSNQWASTYASHFLVMAKRQGYAVPQQLMDNTLGYLKDAVSENRAGGVVANTIAAYRLYVLSLSGNAQLAAMNRLRENLMTRQRNQQGNDPLAGWQLAMAYQQSGLPDIAAELLKAANSEAPTQQHYRDTYGSQLRDNAIELMTSNQFTTQKRSWEIAAAVAKELSGDEWHSTQSTAWALLALSDYGLRNKPSDSNRFAITETATNSGWQALESIQHFYTQAVAVDALEQESLKIRNDSAHPLYALVNNQGIAPQGEEKAAQNGLTMSVEFNDINGHPLDINALPQGQDIVARVRVALPEQHNRRVKIEDLALTMVMPSGWQIRNQRLEGTAYSAGLDYQDVRDDRVLSYFSLWSNQRWYHRYSAKHQQEIVVEANINASYAGRYYLPGWQVKAMYDETTFARSAGQWVEVVAEPQSQ